MKVEIVDTIELVEMAAEYNPRKITDEEMEALRGSLRRWGCVEPIVANRRTNCVVGGHQRVLAASLEGLNDLPVVWVDIDVENEKALNLALNQISGSWDYIKLEQVMSDLKIEGWNMADLGFNDDDLSSFDNEWADPKDIDSVGDYSEETDAMVIEIKTNRQDGNEVERIVRTALEGVECLVSVK